MVTAKASTAFESTNSSGFASAGPRLARKMSKLLITIRRWLMRNIDAVTPGELLKEDFLEPMGISQYRLAKEIGVPAQRIGQIIAGKRSITEIGRASCRERGWVWVGGVVG